jgi:hypothetical protein
VGGRRGGTTNAKVHYGFLKQARGSSEIDDLGIDRFRCRMEKYRCLRKSISIYIHKCKSTSIVLHHLHLHVPSAMKHLAMPPPYTHPPHRHILRRSRILQSPLLKSLLVALNSIPDHKVLPVFERDAAFGILAHLLDILLLRFERVDDTCRALAHVFIK